MRGQLLEDPETVAPIYARSIDRFGVGSGAALTGGVGLLGACLVHGAHQLARG